MGVARARPLHECCADRACHRPAEAAPSTTDRVLDIQSDHEFKTKLEEVASGSCTGAGRGGSALRPHAAF